MQGDNTLPYLSPRPKEVWYLFEGPPIAPWPDTVGCWWSWCRSWGNECKAIRPYPVCYPVPYYTCERESERTRCEFPWSCIGGAETVEMEPVPGACDDLDTRYVDRASARRSHPTLSAGPVYKRDVDSGADRSRPGLLLWLDRPTPLSGMCTMLLRLRKWPERAEGLQGGFDSGFSRNRSDPVRPVG